MVLVVEVGYLRQSWSADGLGSFSLSFFNSLLISCFIFLTLLLSHCSLCSLASTGACMENATVGEQWAATSPAQ